MQKRDISDNDRAWSFTGRSTNTTKDRGAEERIVRGRSGSPNARSHGDDRGYDCDWSSAQATRQWHPDEVREPQDQDGHANEIYNSRQRRIKVLHVVRYLRSQRQRPDAIVEGAKRHGAHGEPLPRSTPVQRVVGIIRGLWHKSMLPCMLQVNIGDYITTSMSKDKHHRR